MKRLLLALLSVLLFGCVTELLDKPLPGAYQPSVEARDLYRFGVIDCNGIGYTIIALETPSRRAPRGHWYVVPVDVIVCPGRFK